MFLNASTCLNTGILGMDYECVNSFVAIVLVAVNGSETRRSLGKR